MWIRNAEKIDFLKRNAKSLFGLNPIENRYDSCYLSGSSARKDAFCEWVEGLAFDVEISDEEFEREERERGTHKGVNGGSFKYCPVQGWYQV